MISTCCDWGDVEEYECEIMLHSHALDIAEPAHETSPPLKC